MVVKMFSRVGFTFFKRIVVSVFILFLLAFESTNAAADHFTSEKYQSHNTNLLVCFNQIVHANYIWMNYAFQGHDFALDCFALHAIV